AESRGCHAARSVTWTQSSVRSSPGAAAGHIRNAVRVTGNHLMGTGSGNRRISEGALDRRRPTGHPRRATSESLAPRRAIREEPAMTSPRREGVNRRHFLWTTAGLVAAAGMARSDDRPPVTSPRATSGDAVGPAWEQRLTITVGPRD